MTQSQIQYFLTVVEQMSISKAADLLFVSQPAVSKQISTLEDELGVMLFERNNKGIIITEGGKAFAKLFTDFSLDLTNMVAHFQQDLYGEFNLGLPEAWDIGSFYPFIRRSLEKDYPNLRLNVHGYNLNHLSHSLQRGELSAAICFSGLFSDLPEYSIQPLLEVDGILLFSKHNPLAKKKGLCLADFKDSVFYVTTPLKMISWCC